MKTDNSTGTLHNKIKKKMLITGFGCLLAILPIILVLVFYHIPDEYWSSIIDLSGKWKIHEGKNDSWKNELIDDSRWKDMQVPGEYTEQGFRDKYCTLRKKLTLKKNMIGKDLFFLIGATTSSVGRVYINGIKTGEIGIYDIKRKPNGIYGLDGFTIKKEYLHENVNVIAIELYYDFFCDDGILDPRLYLGVNQYLRPYYEANQSLRLFFQYGMIYFSIFVLLLLGAFLVTEWGFTDRHKYISTMFLVSGGLLYNLSFSGVFISLKVGLPVLNKILLISIVLTMFGLLEFIIYYFTEKIDLITKANRFITIITCAIMAAVSDGMLLQDVYNYFTYYIFLLLLYFLFITLRDLLVRKTKEYGVIITISTMIGAGSGISDLLVDLGISNAPMLFTTALSSVCVCATVVVVVDFIEISILNRKLSIELKTLNMGLEEKVKKRTLEFERANDELGAINEQLAITRDSLWAEMEIAKKIQTMLLPKNPQIQGYEISAFMKPADEVGGDYYDIINAQGCDWIIIGDVSGHGVPAGLVMMMVQTAIQVTILNNPEMPPYQLLTRINQTIKKNIENMNDDKYMTITAFSVFNNGKFYFSGLHQDILIYRALTKRVELINTEGMWIGIMDDIQGMMTDSTLTVGPGDVILLYTDGITEAWEMGSIKDIRNPNEQMYGRERLTDIFCSLGSLSTEKIMDGILASLDGYEFSDDITLVLLKRT